MKKFVSIVLVAVLCFAFCVPALAASGTAEAAYTGQTSSEEVKITINGEVIHVYYVEIEFTSNPVFLILISMSPILRRNGRAMVL